MSNNLMIKDNFFDLFPSIFDNFYRTSSSLPNLFKVDILEDEKSYLFEAELPGLDKEDIIIDYHNDILSIKATKKDYKKEEDKNNKIIRRERSFGEISRQFYLQEVDKENITANYENGLLKVVLPKLVKDDTRKRITVK